MKDLKAQYLQFYKRADDILKQPDNPCAFIMVDGLATCRVSRVDKSYPPGKLCCAGCEHHDMIKGCTVKSLSCKLGWCYVSRGSVEGMKMGDHPAFEQLAALKQEVWKSDVPMGHRKSVEQNFDPKVKRWRI